MNVKILPLFLLISGMLHAQLQQKVDALAIAAEMQAGQLVFIAKDLNTGKTLASHDTQKRISPASTLKILTCYAAMDILGADHVFVTKVGASGKVNADGVLIGDLIIEAGGDPALESDDFMKEYGNGSPIAAQVMASLKARVIKSIQGNIIIDESIYSGEDIPDEWTWQDMGNYYAAGAHAFTYKENMFVAELQSTEQIGAVTRLRSVKPDQAGITFINEVTGAAIRGDEAYFYGAPGSKVMRLHGKIPLGEQSFTVKGAMPDPATSFKSELSSMFEKTGIKGLGMETESKVAKDIMGSTMVEEYLVLESPRLESLIAHTLMESDNLYAEHFLRQISRAKKGNGSTADGLEKLMEWCKEKGLNTGSITVKDGSGLSRGNAVTAEFMVALLERLSKETYFEAFKNGLPVAGRSGSMNRMGKGTSIEGKLWAKSGYIEGARGYVGYVLKGGSYTAFCMLAEDYLFSPTAMRLKMEEVMVEMGE
jgi:serine-type D-Ala-D-Ala carboxypeptidase/endopeptidase (penicillin-binding protein 4)